MNNRLPGFPRESVELTKLISQIFFLKWLLKISQFVEVQTIPLVLVLVPTYSGPKCGTVRKPLPHSSGS